jgi:ubiquitin-protein ligase
MSVISVVVKEKLSGEELDIDIDDADTVGKLAEGIRRELKMPDRDSKGGLTYKLVHGRTGLLLSPSQSLRDAGVQTGDTLTFWGEPTAAGSDDFLRRRLQGEYEEVMERYGNHPRVKVKTSGNPPNIYTVTYTLKAPVARDGTGFVFGATHVVRITVPNEYPQAPAQVHMESPACHPNISPSSDRKVCTGDDHHTGLSIADLIAKVGNYLQYREFGHDRPYDRELSNRIQAERIGPFDDASFEKSTG